VNYETRPWQHFLRSTNNFLLKICYARASRAAQWFSKALGFLFVTALFIIISFEIFYAWNNQITYYPLGLQPWLSSKVRYENYNGGYNELTQYFEKEFRGKIPALTFDLRYQFLNRIRDGALERGIQEKKAPYSALVVTYGNFDKAGKLWALDRLHIYHAWPIISLEDYYQYIRENGNDFYTRSGFRAAYFIIPTNTVSRAEFSTLVSGTQPFEVKNPRGDTAFLIYKKPL